MQKISSFFYKLWLKIKFGQSLYLAPNVVILKDTLFIIDKDSKIEINSGCIIRSGTEFRATKNSKLIVERNVKVDKLVRIIATNDTTVNIGQGCKIGIGTVFNGGGNIDIGDKTLISGYVYIQTSMHNHNTNENKDIIDNGYTYADIKIGRGSWLGVHSVIFPGVTLGDRAIIGSNAVVNKSFEKNSIIGGIPAKRLK